MPYLPYNNNSLSPFITEKTFDNHYEKHHEADVNNLTGSVMCTPIE
ncbi:hypothetical protein [Maribacter polysiphoniae]|nr:hypothetical protein [Maribacter polysiphoniae]